jgi:hypothetical protein
MGYFEDIVDMATKQFVDIKRRFNLNEHHTDVTRKMKQAGKIPHFLSLTTPKVSTDLFPADTATELEASYKTVLKRTSEELLDLTIAARENMDAKLRREAETVMVDIRQAAMQKWMDVQQVGSQTNYNRWDHVFPVFDSRRNPVPLSSVIFRTAMKECQAKVSRILEQEMQAKKEQHDARRRENEKRKEVFRKDEKRKEDTPTLTTGGICEWRYASNHLRDTTSPLIQQLRHRQTPGKTGATPGSAEGANASAGSGAGRTHEGNGHSLQESEQTTEGGVDSAYVSVANRAIGVGSRPTCWHDPHENDPLAA